MCEAGVFFVGASGKAASEHALEAMRQARTSRQPNNHKDPVATEDVSCCHRRHVFRGHRRHVFCDPRGHEVCGDRRHVVCRSRRLSPQCLWCLQKTCLRGEQSNTIWSSIHSVLYISKDLRCIHAVIRDPQMVFGHPVVSFQERKRALVKNTSLMQWMVQIQSTRNNIMTIVARFGAANFHWLLLRHFFSLRE